MKILVRVAVFSVATFLIGVWVGKITTENPGLAKAQTELVPVAKTSHAEQYSASDSTPVSEHVESEVESVSLGISQTPRRSGTGNLPHYTPVELPVVTGGPLTDTGPYLDANVSGWDGHSYGDGTVQDKGMHLDPFGPGMASMGLKYEAERNAGFHLNADDDSGYSAFNPGVTYRDKGEHVNPDGLAWSTGLSSGSTTVQDIGPRIDPDG